jgi:NAD(P)-dependent dehydrogenase (short-subunit alcohol dehydrogenase family)
MQLRGQYALITGAARRLGREIAETLAGRGAYVVCHYHRSGAEARALCGRIERAGGRALAVAADFARPAGLAARIRRFAAQVLGKVPRIDILVNNAADFYPTPLGRVREADWDHFMALNLKAPFFLAQEFGLRMFKRKRGVIVNLADWTALKPHPRYLPYAVSKAGLVALTAGLARALAPHVRVNGIAPGPILKARGMSAAQARAVARGTLLKRFGRPEDIARAVRFLCEDNDYITGAMIPVEGGALIA